MSPFESLFIQLLVNVFLAQMLTLAWANKEKREAKKAFDDLKELQK
jgi:hypothetical protein